MRYFDFRNLLIGASILFAIHAIGTNGFEKPASLTWQVVLVLSGTGLVIVTLVVPASRDRHLYLFERGFAHVGHGRMDLFPFDQLASVQQKNTDNYLNGHYDDTEHTITVTRADGLKLTFTDRYGQIGEFGRVLAAHRAATRLLRLVEALHAGGEVPMGAFTLSLDGLRKGRDTLPWNEIDRVVLHKGRLKVYRTGRFTSWADVAENAVGWIVDFNALLKICSGKQIDSSTEPVALPKADTVGAPTAPGVLDAPAPSIPRPEHLTACPGNEEDCPDPDGHRSTLEHALRVLDEARQLPLIGAVHSPGWATETLHRLGHDAGATQASRLARQHLRALTQTPTLSAGLNQAALTTAHQVAVHLSETRRPVAEQITHARTWTHLATRFGHDPAPAQTWLDRLTAWRDGEADPTGVLPPAPDSGSAPPRR
ncbi:DUF6585 family protein [Kitasatospora griseola]|uniref:DUF6585 family protein n=1 Tax=Kitasatospora griseola TaxID=2064 RepID=UPI00364E99BF